MYLKRLWPLSDGMKIFFFDIRDLKLFSGCIIMISFRIMNLKFQINRKHEPRHKINTVLRRWKRRPARDPTPIECPMVPKVGKKSRI
ncbi:MAG: hypothetical protein Hyperionvirus29_26 [Hyperionvirus sp.]|uniref:Uncharacterized protein n=1 Tax=Hyperionvirus sp. TaxID=2487770 RepID=A0A3G5AFB0_9VIRU|nr:MAG: hypothetical protein Hyperionvirus29_26 [Hyperionvirus sp.]